MRALHRCVLAACCASVLAAGTGQAAGQPPAGAAGVAQKEAPAGWQAQASGPGHPSATSGRHQGKAASGEAAPARGPGVPARLRPLEALDVQVVSVRLTAAGYMLDLRLRVGDGKKARPIFDRKLRPYIVEEKTGYRFYVPESSKLGPLRQAPQRVRSHRVYFLLFANPGRRIRHGDRISFVVGDYGVRHLVVQ
ncbi:MAG: hypothetical protein D6721_08155 [Gammaproteobacteria bacterium]|nr:MAG: hypothetical protein D6721_08155 [Gammaproteobacteria bacterium]